MRRTKIVCTLGPATDDPNILEAMMLKGMNVARLNFSHGNHEEQKKRVEKFKELRRKLNLPIALLLDTKGPEIRIKTFKNSPVMLKDGQNFTLTSRDVEGDNNIVSITYQNLPKEVSPQCRILIDDGLIELVVTEVKNETDIICKVLNSGEVGDKKSLNIPGTSIKIPYISKKDKSDILFAIENDFDFIAASFVREALDVIEIKKILEANNGDQIHIISKIENADGVNNIDDILKVSDGIMVARGDLGVEIPFQEIPVVQKMLIEKCCMAGKKSITATQMLDSMIRNPRPTRAEVTDVANAIYDGTSALMLSGETSVGKYPINAVDTMSKIAIYTEQCIDYKKRFSKLDIRGVDNVTNAISHATCTTAHDIGAAAILTVTRSGYTARMVSKFRPACPIITTTTSKKVLHHLALSWGIVPLLAKERATTDELFEQAVEKAMETGLVKNGDITVITAGVPVGVSGTTNILKVHLVGHVLVKGSGIVNKSISGKVCVANSEQMAHNNFEKGDILVINKTTNNLLDIIKQASGIITEEEGVTSHAAIVGMTLDIPVVVGAPQATKILKSGSIVTMDGERGTVYNGITKVM